MQMKVEISCIYHINKIDFVDKMWLITALSLQLLVIKCNPDAWKKNKPNHAIAGWVSPIPFCTIAL